MHFFKDGVGMSNVMTVKNNIFTNNIDEVGTSGILLNSISDHQMIFTYVENVSYIAEVSKFIEIERSDNQKCMAL